MNYPPVAPGGYRWPIRNRTDLLQPQQVEQVGEVTTIIYRDSFTGEIICVEQSIQTPQPGVIYGRLSEDSGTVNAIHALARAQGQNMWR